MMKRLPGDSPLSKRVEGSIEKPLSQRVSVNLPEPAVLKLDEIARAKGISTSEVARSAIKRDLQIRKLEEEGGKLLVEMPNGKTFYLLPDD